MYDVVVYVGVTGVYGMTDPLSAHSADRWKCNTHHRVHLHASILVIIRFLEYPDYVLHMYTSYPGFRNMDQPLSRFWETWCWDMLPTEL